MWLGRGLLEAVLVVLPVVQLAEPARRAAGAAWRGWGGRAAGRGGRPGKGGTARLAWPASDRCTAAGDPPCAATIATAVAQPAMAADPASTKTPVRKRTSSSQA